MGNISSTGGVDRQVRHFGSPERQVGSPKRQNDGPGGSSVDGKHIIDGGAWDPGGVNSPDSRLPGTREL